MEELRGYADQAQDDAGTEGATHHWRYSHSKAAYCTAMTLTTVFTRLLIIVALHLSLVSYVAV